MLVLNSDASINQGKAKVRIQKRTLVFNLFDSVVHDLTFTNIIIIIIIIIMTTIIIMRIIMSNVFDSAVILLTAAQTKLSGRAGAIVKSAQKT